MNFKQCIILTSILGTIGLNACALDIDEASVTAEAIGNSSHAVIAADGRSMSMGGFNACNLGISFGVDSGDLIFGFEDNLGRIVTTRVGEDVKSDQVRVAWAGGRAYFAYRSTFNTVMAGWADINGNWSEARQVLTARTDETPNISFNGIILVTYEGRRSDDIFFSVGSPTNGVTNWTGNQKLGNGAQTRYGPDYLCPAGSNFILGYRGRNNTSAHYEAEYRSTSASWGGQQRISSDERFCH